jgi:hypothetical protein
MTIWDALSVGDLVVCDKGPNVATVKNVDLHPSGQLRCIVVEQYKWSFIGRERNAPLDRSAVLPPGYVHHA